MSWRRLASLKAEYEAGKRGEDSPPAPIWATPSQQLDAVLRLLRPRQKAAPQVERPDVDADAAVVADAMRGVDWAAVKEATTRRTGEATQAMRTIAAQVDWAKVQPVAAHVSTALIAAVASGRIRVGGPIGPIVARTIVDQGGLAQAVADKLDATKTPVPPDFRQVIDTTATEGTPPE